MRDATTRRLFSRWRLSAALIVLMVLMHASPGFAQNAGATGVFEIPPTSTLFVGSSPDHGAGLFGPVALWDAARQTPSLAAPRPANWSTRRSRAWLPESFAG